MYDEQKTDVVELCSKLIDEAEKNERMCKYIYERIEEIDEKINAIARALNV